MLDQDTAELLDRRFGFSTGEPTTIHQEAERLGVEPVEVRRRESEALRALRDAHTPA